MEYTQEMYEEDRAIVTWVFNNRINKDKILNEYKQDLFTLFAMSMVYASIIEYITSYLMEKIF